MEEEGGREERNTQKKDEQTSVHLSGSKTESVSFSLSPCVVRVFASLCFPFFFSSSILVDTASLSQHTHKNTTTRQLVMCTEQTCYVHL